MVSFILSLVALILGYLLYGRFVEKVFGPDDRVTPAVAKADGVDYLVLPGWKIFMIQFLNIAGTGPIFGAILGAKFGPVAYLWIVLGCIFAGATHDYLSGMLSMRNDGASLLRLRSALLRYGVLAALLRERAAPWPAGMSRGAAAGRRLRRPRLLVRQRRRSDRLPVQDQLASALPEPVPALREQRGLLAAAPVRPVPAASFQVRSWPSSARFAPS